MYDEPVAPPANNGDNDVSATGDELPFLLIRGLKANTSETLLSKGLEKLYIEQDTASAQAALPSSLFPGAGAAGLAQLAAILPAVKSTSSGASLNSLKRVFVIRDCDTEKGLTYGFAEYHSVADARAALAKADSLGDKCTISSKRIDVGYPHMGVFPAVVHGQDSVDSRHMFQFKDGTFHRYHDPRYYASVLDINAQPPSRPESLFDEEKAKKTKKRVKDSTGNGTLDNNTSIKKAKLGNSKTIGIVDQWTKKQAELRGEAPVHERSATPESDALPEEPAQQSYVFEGEKGGKQRKVCLLCGTEIPERVTVAMHVLDSKLHAANLLDESKCQKGLQKIVEWAGITPDQTVQVRVAAPEKPKVIRDRAKERREQEAKSGTSEKLKVSLKDVKKGGPVGKPAAVEPSYGKGMAMLQKAGWKEGQGLGSGSGISAPIEQISYNAGVGLGHEGSKKGDAIEEATRMTKDDGGFLEKTKEVARQRFERM